MRQLLATLMIFFSSGLSFAMPSLEGRLPVNEDEVQAVISDLLGAPAQNLDMSKVKKITNGNRGYTIHVALDEPIKFTFDNLCYKEQVYLKWRKYYSENGSRSKSNQRRYFGAFPNKAGKPCTKDMRWTELSTPHKSDITPYRLLLFTVKVKEWIRTVSKESFCYNLHGRYTESECEYWSTIKAHVDSHLIFISYRQKRHNQSSSQVKGIVHLDIRTGWGSGINLEFDQTDQELKIGKFTVSQYII